MKTIRNGVFETNSSSCHSVTIINKNDVEKLKHQYYLIINRTPDFWEHETFLTPIESSDIYSPEEAAEKLRPFLEDTSDESLSSYRDDFNFIKDNLGAEILKYIYFPEEEDNEFNKRYNDGDERVEDPYYYRDILSNLKGLTIGSFYTIVDIDDESGIAEETEITTPSGDVVQVFNSLILC